MKQTMRDQLERGGRSFAAAFAAISPEEAQWRPAEGKWSLLEILGHLLDEERGDFRVRVRMTLEDPTAAWPGIDPEGWVVERKHNELDPARLLAELLQERQASLAWLDSLGDEEWDKAYEHPQIGRLRAGDLLTAWAVHDQLHLAQVAKLRADWIEARAGDFDGRYARP